MNPTHSTALDEKIDSVLVDLVQVFAYIWDDVDAKWWGHDTDLGNQAPAFEQAKTAIKNLVLVAKRNLVAIGRERIDNDPTYTLEAFIEDCEEYLDRTELTTKKEQ